MADYSEIIERIMDAYDYEEFLQLLCEFKIEMVVRFAEAEGLLDDQEEQD